ncbi:hypothetical protein Pcinc_042682 [Petrolisthes cinctipes]|uniref:Uncharacterized protein n=1 Tax=Petrolisthes cinctipes TaxID=88211 RepID=A0AAE1BHF7_PETCI|nr:hypothetical protein Pcinc_042682 [Petrolisthes cinctipes]
MEERRRRKGREEKEEGRRGEGGREERRRRNGRQKEEDEIVKKIGTLPLPFPLQYPSNFLLSSQPFVYLFLSSSPPPPSPAFPFTLTSFKPLFSTTPRLTLPLFINPTSFTPSPAPPPVFLSPSGGRCECCSFYRKTAIAVTCTLRQQLHPSLSSQSRYPGGAGDGSPQHLVSHWGARNIYTGGDENHPPTQSKQTLPIPLSHPVQTYPSHTPMSLSHPVQTDPSQSSMSLSHPVQIDPSHTPMSLSHPVQIDPSHTSMSLSHPVKIDPSHTPMPLSHPVQTHPIHPLRFSPR